MAIQMQTVYDMYPNIDRMPRRNLDTYPELRDPVFQECYEVCKPYSMTHIPAFYNTYRSLQYIAANTIPGDLTECGCFLGGSTLFILLMREHFGLTDRRLTVFDTFTGFPPGQEDAIRGEHYVATDFLPEGADFQEAFMEDISRHADPASMTVVRGFVEETMPAHDFGPQSLLRLDTDFYASTKVELEILYPLLSGGGVVIIDDYGCFDGSRQASDEYFEQVTPRPLLQRIDHGTYCGVKPTPVSG